MKATKVILIASCIAMTISVYGQENHTYNNGYWQIGIGLGEIPMDGSFKPSITFGYHFNEKVYTGLIYQFKDQIQRNESSINARSAGLEGLVSASENVAQRFMLQIRYTPIKNGPYVSGGIVYNGQDNETMKFKKMTRTLSGEVHSGDIIIQQTRPAGWGLALGLGYQYNFKNGFSTGFEWTPAWGQYPTPSYSFAGSPELSPVAKKELAHKMNEGFKSSVTNMYKVFHFGIAYRFR